MTPARRALLLAAPLWAWAGRAQAGAQIEEPLANAVRSALSAAVADAAPPKPSFETMDQRLAYLRWLGQASDRLKRRKTENHTLI